MPNCEDCEHRPNFKYIAPNMTAQVGRCKSNQLVKDIICLKGLDYYCTDALTTDGVQLVLSIGAAPVVLTGPLITSCPVHRKRVVVKMKPKTGSRMAKKMPQRDQTKPAPDDEPSNPPSLHRGIGGPAYTECPHGHVFARDCDAFLECDDCEAWGDCCEADDAATSIKIFGKEKKDFKDQLLDDAICDGDGDD